MASLGLVQRRRHLNITNMGTYGSELSFGKKKWPRFPVLEVEPRHPPKGEKMRSSTFFWGFFASLFLCQPHSSCLFVAAVSACVPCAQLPSSSFIQVAQRWLWGSLSSMANGTISVWKPGSGSRNLEEGSLVQLGHEELWLGSVSDLTASSSVLLVSSPIISPWHALSRGNAYWYKLTDCHSNCETSNRTQNAFAKMKPYAAGPEQVSGKHGRSRKWTGILPRFTGAGVWQKRQKWSILWLQRHVTHVSIVSIFGIHGQYFLLHYASILCTYDYICTIFHISFPQLEWSNQKNKDSNDVDVGRLEGLPNSGPYWLLRVSVFRYSQFLFFEL